MKKEDEKMYTSSDIIKMCGVSKTKAYTMIRSLNNKLISEGTPRECTVPGKISKIYFHRHIKF